MINEKCSSYPCHKNLEDCTLCYCPAYPCYIRGLGEKIVGKDKKEIWDCSKCEIVHQKEFMRLIQVIMRNMLKYHISDNKKYN